MGRLGESVSVSDMGTEKVGREAGLADREVRLRRVYVQAATEHRLDHRCVSVLRTRHSNIGGKRAVLRKTVRKEEAGGYSSKAMLAPRCCDRMRWRCGLVDDLYIQVFKPAILMAKLPHGGRDAHVVLAVGLLGRCEIRRHRRTQRLPS